MSSVTFYKICELLLVVIYAFGADYYDDIRAWTTICPEKKDSVL